MERADESYDFNNLGNNPSSRGSSSGRSGCGKFAIGCGIVMAVLALALGLTIWYAASHLRELGSDFAAFAMKQSLKELQLPQDQADRIDARIDELAEKFKNEELTGDQIKSIFEQIGNGPLIPAGMALVVERAYLQESGLDDAEKEAAKITIQRFTHGAVNHSIPEAEISAALDEISEETEEGGREFRSPVSDDELRAFLAKAKDAADKAEIPEEVPTINFADEFDRAVDRALSGEPPPSAEPVDTTDAPLTPEAPDSIDAADSTDTAEPSNGADSTEPAEPAEPEPTEASDSAATDAPAETESADAETPGTP